LRWKWKIRLGKLQQYIVGENQQQQYQFLFDAQSEATHALRFCVERNATLTVHVVIVHTSVQLKIECVLHGEGAYANIFGAYMLSDSHAVKIDTVQHHEAAHTSSNLIMKGALQDKASAYYHGTIRVEKEAHGAHACQQNKNILLSNSARAVSVPNLEVLNNEVKCFHGSAIGTFDQEQLFYAASRGIDEKTAERILLDAFFCEVIDQKMFVSFDKLRTNGRENILTPVRGELVEPYRTANKN
jgi:Fe-S cluster assembly scaffold protein SufB